MTHPAWFEQEAIEEMQAGPSEGLRAQSGQVIVLMALALVALLAMVALVVDGGNAFVQQRISQSATDASAEAGALQLAQRLQAGTGTPPTDAEVLSAMVGMAATNGVALAGAEYTAGDGTSLGISVGSAPLGKIPDTAFGVRAIGAKTFNTYLASVIGFNTLQASTSATAVAGYKLSTCDSSKGCALLPITPPIDQLTCDGSNKPLRTGTVWDRDTVYKVPLCATGAGNVGWIDWFPPDGGTSDTIASVEHPDNPGITFPTWIQISQTGNTNSQDLENAINQYSGQPVLLPIFTHTCGSEPVGDLSIVQDATNGCLTNLDDGNGSQMWYYLQKVDSFLLCGPGITGCGSPDLIPPATKGAYIAGSNTICDTGNGATSCLIGSFQSGYVSPGEIDPNFPIGGTSMVNGVFVQLIR